MKIKILSFLIAAASVVSTAQASTQPGWGSKQTQRTIGGILGGATIGGIIGHQHDKQKEGIIIGTVLGGLIGNRSGANKDYRNEQAAWEAQKRRWAEQERARKRRESQSYRPVIQTPVYSNTSGSLHNDPEVVAARQRAEQLELQLQRQQQAQQRALQKQRMLQEYAERQARASKQLGNY